VLLLSLNVEFILFKRNIRDLNLYMCDKCDVNFASSDCAYKSLIVINDFFLLNLDIIFDDSAVDMKFELCLV
jgi:hypothetical protein